jgi:murein endopeptidase
MISFLKSLSGITAMSPYNAPNWYVEDISMHRAATEEEEARGGKRAKPGFAGLLPTEKKFYPGPAAPKAHGSHQIGLDVDLSIPTNQSAQSKFPSGASITPSTEEKDCPLGFWDPASGTCKKPAWRYKAIAPSQINSPAMVKFLMHCARGGGAQWQVKRVLINVSLLGPVRKMFRKMASMKLLGNDKKLIRRARWLLFPWAGHKNHIHVRLCIPSHPENKYRC